MSKTAKILGKVIKSLDCKEFYTVGDFNKKDIICETPVKDFPLTRFKNLCNVHGLDNVILLVNKNYVILVTEATIGV